MMVWLLLGCLERVTGGDVPLDPRFYESVEAVQGDPGQGAGGHPFATYTGETVTIEGTIISENTEMPIDLAVRLPDPQAEGGVRSEGRFLIDAVGPFSFAVPKGLGRMELEALQDPDTDGPSGDDPYASAWVEVGEEDVSGIELVMEPGSFGAGGPTHTAAPPGAPGGDPSAAPPGEAGGDPSAAPEGQPSEAPPGAPGGDPSAAPPGAPESAPPGTGDIPPFADLGDNPITIHGTLVCEICQGIDLDLFQPDPDSPGGRRMLGKIKRAAGAYELQVPAGFGPMLLEAFSDLAGDGPGAGDPMGRYEGNPLQIGNEDLFNVDIPLVVTEDGRMPSERPAPPPQQTPPP